MLTASVTYPGINTITGARLTFSNGARWGAGTITMLPQDGFAPGAPQTMTWQSSVGTLAFPNCTLDVNHLRRRETRDGWRWDVKVFDRRFLWWRYTIDCRWNVRLPDGSVREDTKKNAQELCELILDAIGETTADVSKVPDDLYPPCQYRGVNAAALLWWLCEYCSVAIGFKTDNTVQLVPYGEGDNLVDVLPSTTRINPVARWKGMGPTTLQGVSGPTIYQSRLRMRPLMTTADEETATSPDLIDYGPTLGFPHEPWTNFGNIANANRYLAEWQFCRWFQAVSQANDGHEVPGSTTDVNHIRQLLPLHRWLVDGFKDSSDPPLQWQWPPVLRGNYWPQGLRPINLTDQEWTGMFDLHHETGLINTEYPIFTVENTYSQEQVEFALFMTAAYNVRNHDTGELDRLKIDRDVDGETGVKVLLRPEVYGAVVQRYGAENAPTELRDTRDDATTELNAYLDAFEKRFADEALVRDVAEVPGYPVCPLDGRIAQIDLQYGYGQAPSLTASQGYEADIYNQSFEQMLLKAEVVRLAAEAA
jgi:hypothetical protein